MMILGVQWWNGSWNAAAVDTSARHFLLSNWEKARIVFTGTYKFLELKAGYDRQRVWKKGKRGTLNLDSNLCLSTFIGFYYFSHYRWRCMRNTALGKSYLLKSTTQPMSREKGKQCLWLLHVSCIIADNKVSLVNGSSRFRTNLVVNVAEGLLSFGVFPSDFGPNYGSTSVLEETHLALLCFSFFPICDQKYDYRCELQWLTTEVMEILMYQWKRGHFSITRR